jgi:hypothetical protein
MFLIFGFINFIFANQDCLNFTYENINEFRWIGGNNIIKKVGVYGIKGDYDANNVPGSRDRHDSILYGNSMIIFGGSGFTNSSFIGLLNDFWEFDFLSYQFRWIGGVKTANERSIYGTKEFYSPSNLIGGRQDHTCILYNNSIVIFGGSGYDNTSQGYLNDIWQFDFLSYQFRWIAGNNIINQAGIYGTNGDYDSSNVPGSRETHTSVLYDNTMIIFGGFGYDNSTTTTGRLNDVWQYNFTSKQFRWIGGNNIINQAGIYGTKGDYDSSNVPGARRFHTSVLYGNTMIIFGGNGFDNSSSSTERLNDVWQFDLLSYQFRWIGGSKVVDQDADYGIRRF